MKKLIFILIAIAGLGGTAYYYQDEIAAVMSPNDKGVVAKQFWIKHKNDIASGNPHALPLSAQVINIDFSFGQDQLDNGKYYLDTTLYINNRYAVPIFTVIEPIEGQWHINIEETFSSIPDAALNRFTTSFSDTIIAANEFVTLPLFKGLPAEIEEGQKEEVARYIDEQFEEAKQAFLDAYMTRTAK